MIKKITVLSLSFFCCTFVHAQKNVISLLNDRFSFSFPDSAVVNARGVDIMSADPNAGKETRVIYDIGTQRMVFFAQELLLKAPADIEAKLKKEIGEDNSFTYEKAEKNDSTGLYLFTPKKFAADEKAILIRSVLVRNAE